MTEIVERFFAVKTVGVRSFVGDDGEPWFVAKDVCDVLGLADVAKACERLGDDEVIKKPILTDRGEREMLIVNEPGLYWLIVRSDKPEAKPFIRWITHEVLPSIRKTGGYSMAGRLPKKATRWGWQPIRDVLREHGYTAKSFVKAANELDLPDVANFTEGNFAPWSYGGCLPADSLVVRAEKLLNEPRERLFTAEVLAAYPTRGPGRRHERIESE